MSSLSAAQKLSVVALVLGVVVFVGGLAYWDAFDTPPTLMATEVVSATRDCIRDAQTDAEIDDCADRTSGDASWQTQHPVLASLLAGGATFFVIAGAGRLFLK